MGWVMCGVCAVSGPGVLGITNFPVERLWQRTALSRKQ